MNDDVVSAKEMINRAFSNIESSAFDKNSKITNAWKNTVSKLSMEGEKLAAHSRIIDLKNGVLLIEADHPGWIQMLQMQKKFILKGLNFTVKELDIKTLAFRLKGTDAKLAAAVQEEIEVQESEEFHDNIRKAENQLERMGYRASKKKGELPKELTDIFESLKNDMLTNKQN